MPSRGFSKSDGVSRESLQSANLNAAANADAAADDDYFNGITVFKLVYLLAQQKTSFTFEKKRLFSDPVSCYRERKTDYFLESFQLDRFLNLNITQKVFFYFSKDKFKEIK